MPKKPKDSAQKFVTDTVIAFLKTTPDNSFTFEDNLSSLLYSLGMGAKTRNGMEQFREHLKILDELMFPKDSNGIPTANEIILMRLCGGERAYSIVKKELETPMPRLNEYGYPEKYNIKHQPEEKVSLSFENILGDLKHKWSAIELMKHQLAAEKREEAAQPLTQQGKNLRAVEKQMGRSQIYGASDPTYGVSNPSFSSKPPTTEPSPSPSESSGSARPPKRPGAT